MGKIRLVCVRCASSLICVFSPQYNKATEQASVEVSSANKVKFCIIILVYLFCKNCITLLRSRVRLELGKLFKKVSP